MTIENQQRRRKRRSFFALLLTACACTADPPFPLPDELDKIGYLAAVRSLPPRPTNALADNPAAAALGARLFRDTGLSGCGIVSCSTCHTAPSYAAPGQAKSTGCSDATSEI